MMALTPKQQRFVEEYLIDLNASRAYRAAGYKGNDNVCAVEGHKLLSNPKVQPVISAGKLARSEETGITAKWVLEQAAKVYREAHTDNDRKNALRALEMCGKHVDVGAFKEGAANVNVNVNVGLEHFYGGDAA
jgi:phage terminase small subunit